MKKPYFLVIVLILMLVSEIPVAVAAIQAGASCTKINATATISGYKYTCIKSGKKLIWSKGVKVSSTKPSNTTEPKEIISFQDAIDRPQDVSYWAWKKSSIQVLGNDSKSPEATILIGPNTKLSNPNPIKSFDAVTKLYPDFRKPRRIYAIFYSFKDINWAQEQYNAVYSGASGQEAKSSCQTIDFCWGASGTINNSGDGVLLAAVMTSNPDINHTSGTLEAHEYTHILQIGNFYGTPNQMQAMCCIKAFTPWWFVEGGAEFSQIAAIYASSFANYSKDRKIWAEAILENKERKFTESWITNFIKPPNNLVWSDPSTQWHLYDLGMLVSEIFTAIKGPAINLQIFKDISSGMSYEESFALRFGIKWDEAVPLISKSISRLIGN